MRYLPSPKLAGFLQNGLTAASIAGSFLIGAALAACTYSSF